MPSSIARRHRGARRALGGEDGRNRKVRRSAGICTRERIDTKVPVSTHTGRDPTVRPQPGPTREKDRRRPTSLGHRALGQYQPQSAPRCRPTPLTRRVQKSSEECDFWKGFESIRLLHSLHRSFSVTVLQCHGRLVRWPLQRVLSGTPCRGNLARQSFGS